MCNFFLKIFSDIVNAFKKRTSSNSIFMKIEMLRHVLIISEFTQQEDRRKEEDGKTLGSDKRDSPIQVIFT